jgi:hypothetical protein
MSGWMRILLAVAMIPMALTAGAWGDWLGRRLDWLILDRISRRLRRRRGTRDTAPESADERNEHG